MEMYMYLCSHMYKYYTYIVSTVFTVQLLYLPLYLPAIYQIP